MVGWHRHPIGGNGVVESVAVIPHPDGDREEVWLSVQADRQRDVGIRHIEYLDDSGGFYGHLNVDSGLTYDAAPADTFGGPRSSARAGRRHRRGWRVLRRADGAAHRRRRGRRSVRRLAWSRSGCRTPRRSNNSAPRCPVPAGARRARRSGMPRVNIRAIDTMGVKINGYQMPARRSRRSPRLAAGTVHRGLRVLQARLGYRSPQQDRASPAVPLHAAGDLRDHRCRRLLRRCPPASR